MDSTTLSHQPIRKPSSPRTNNSSSSSNRKTEEKKKKTKKPYTINPQSDQENTQEQTKQHEQPPTLADHSTIDHRIPPAGLKQLPARFERCEIEDLIELIGSMLTRLINHNDQIPFTSTSLTRFHSRSPPTITIHDYLRRIYKYTNPEPICLLLILNYIDRICKNLASFTICSLTVHRFCISAVTIGSKFICDSFYSNSRYAKVGGISLPEINLLEREFLLAIDYRLSTTNEELNKYYLSLVESHPMYRIERLRGPNEEDGRPRKATEEGGRAQGRSEEEEEERHDGMEEEEEEEEEQRDQGVGERSSKRIKAKDRLGRSDPNDSLAQQPPPQHSSSSSAAYLPQQPLRASASNVLPDSIIED
ncbi:hypothetical protein PGT21_015733 [Puccinia graminis f. sp. tritici]|uniref:Cyclin-domain-containing protein n=1 Tax=Puccinia graminis f. sp. tritici TaxID=56615 RepID=A0A5B0LNI5_PUCGR|nr:hypothetical protein PGT21_015733 [Puccinia graminis f. sp. tritici]KAA1130538.1 hypothetical protein PGTUg99_018722 [Puccinia graminis f. sp. tritici]